MQETELKLSNEQLSLAIQDHLTKENGLHEVFNMTINALMYVERRSFLNASKDTDNKGNGYRYVQKAGLGSALELRIPRDRLGVFKPVIYGLLKDQENRIRELSFSLYGKGLTTRQISEVLEDIYGTSYSKSAISEITTTFSHRIDAWQNRSLDKHYLAVFVDAFFVKVRRDVVSTEAFYVLMGLKQDFTREVLSIVNLPTESASGWKEALSTIKSRGVETINLFVFDDLKGLDDAIAHQFNDSLQQKCTLHYQKNLSRKIRVKDRPQFCQGLKEIFDADQQITSQSAVENLKNYLREWISKYPSLNYQIKRDDLSLYFTYFKFSKKVRRMIYTTNWIERLNKSFRRTLKIRNALPSPNSAITLIAYVAMEIEDKTYKYPISNFKFDEQFFKWSIEN